MTATQTPTEETPLQQFKKNYVPLYRTLLILSTLAAVLSLTSVSNITTALNLLESDTFYAIGGLVSVAITIPLMIASIILLWQKYPAGIKLRLAAYGTAIITSLSGLLVSQETLNRTVQQAADQALQVGNSMLSREAAVTIAESSYYSAIWFSIVLSVLFALLWWKAWKQQQKHDKNLQKKSK